MDEPRPELTTLGKIFFWRMYVSAAVLTIGLIWMLVWPPENLMIPVAIVVACIVLCYVVFFFARRRQLVKPPSPNPDGPAESN